LLRLYGRQWIKLQRRAEPVKISIIVPVLNEADHIVGLLSSLSALRTAGHEILAVDGGSTDRTSLLARPLCDRVITSPKGRALQMNAGARQATGDMFWFLHADSRLSPETLKAMPALLKEHGWGRFEVCLSGSQWGYRVIEHMMNLRSRITGIATGDQAIFVDRNLFWSVGGYPEIPLMEDIALSKRLRKKMRPAIIEHPLHTSSRRWEKNGLLTTVLLMWRLRLEYFLGMDPQHLAKKYYD
jgi:rSAM/selenodomain-associated transferase 2